MLVHQKRIIIDSELERNRTHPLDRPIQSRACTVPNDVRLEGDRLLWDDTFSHEIAPGIGMLPQFVELYTEPAEKILAYAKKWGVLGLCANHGLPLSHNRVPFGSQFGMEACWPKQEGTLLWEPISSWREFSRCFKTVWSLSQQMNRGLAGNIEDWLVLRRWEPRASDASWIVRDPQDVNRTLALGDSQRYLSSVVNLWLLLGGVRPTCSWSETTNQWELLMSAGWPPLFGQLTMKLMVAVADKEGFATCSNCRNWYIPTKRPSPNRRNYCQRDECKQAAWRDSKRDRRRGNEDGKKKTR